MNTANDFYDWKRHPITEIVFSELRARVNVLTEELIDQTVDGDPRKMAEKVGAIKALTDVLDIEVEPQETE